MLTDNYGRIANYLRIAVTDKCNLRCRYCMPEQGIDFTHKKDLLTYEEIIRLAIIFKKLGVTKARITGGEPFVRKDIHKLLSGLANIFPAIHITTNASLLQDHISDLSKIGISGINISIDSLQKEKFFLITRRDSYDIVIANIKKCLTFNLPIKVNVVVMKNINDNEIIDFVKFGIEHKIEIRFIEAMPFNEDDGNKQNFMSADDIFAKISETYPQIKKIPEGAPSATISYTIDEFKLGIIPAYSRSLCGSCNRIRLTPKGKLLTCLYTKEGLNLLNCIRNDKLTDSELEAIITQTISKKKENGHLEEALRNQTVFQSMTSIGG